LIINTRQAIVVLLDLLEITNLPPDISTGAVVQDRAGMIAGMTPRLDTETYIFCTLPPSGADQHIILNALATFHEAEGISLILPLGKAISLDLPVTQPPMSRITLEVYSSLQGVGLTAAVSSALADKGIACNMVAALHHDHVFVPHDRANEAMDILRALQTSALR
jgi:hypothetical protein